MFDAAEPNLQKLEPNYRDNNVEEHGKMVATGGGGQNWRPGGE